ncbi:MAG: cyclic nucleotide-binding domain-containing protein [Dehalococcoidia bacterium]
MRTKDQKIERLGSIHLFARANDSQLESLASIADEASVPAGTPLAKEGERGMDFFVIESGSAEVTAGGQKLGDLKQGDFFGEIALLEGGLRMATVTATEDSVLLIVRKPAFDKLQETVPGLGQVLREAVEQRRKQNAQ